MGEAAAGRAGRAGAKYTAVGSRQNIKNLVRITVQATVLVSPLYLAKSQPQRSNTKCVCTKPYVVMTEKRNSGTEAG